MGISACFDQSNDIVSNQPDTPVFPCLPSPSLSHFPEHLTINSTIMSLYFILSVGDGKHKMHQFQSTTTIR